MTRHLIRGLDLPNVTTSKVHSPGDCVNYMLTLKQGAALILTLSATAGCQREPAWESKPG